MKRLLVFALAVVFTLALAAQVTAQEVKIGGHVRFNTGWVNQSDEISDTPDSRTDSFWTETGISRLNFSYTGEDNTCFIEVDMKVGLRYIYGTWAFAEGSELLVGHTDTLVAFGFNALTMKGENSLIGFGNLYGHRYPQIRYTRTLEDFGTVKVALIDPMERSVDGMTGTSHAIIPRIEADLDFSVADVSISPSFSFNTFEVENVTESAGGDETVQSWTLGLNFDYALEAVKISGEAYYGTNLFYMDFQENDHSPTVVAGEVDEDTTGYGGWLQVSVPFEPMTLNVGAGMDVASNDEKDPAEDTQTTTGYFANVNYKATGNLTITPEVAIFDYGEDWDGTDNGTETYYGVNWVFVF